ncbi:MAG TPA: cytochrome c oxidase subunit II [Solirubrobacterales bacterium]|nr:cytochrome c oxidase subunit II [Solirubrobacterales bacterium]
MPVPLARPKRRPPGCVGAKVVSPLNPHSPASHDIATLWWWMLLVAGIVFLGAVAMLLVGWFRRGKPGLPFLGESERANTGLVIAFGIAIPLVILIALFIVSDLYVLKRTDAPEVSSTALTVTVVGHQWWWEARYPAGVVTANEIHLPARTPVNLVARSVDVIHSFWVPELNRKIDMIPGQSNRIELYAEEPGVYRGQCAEFCGLQHAHMAFEVHAEPRRAFERWLSANAQPAREPTGAQARQGQRYFMEDGCAACHTIAGTGAEGTVGPNLTHLAGRETLAADTIPNTPGDLFRWIQNPQSVKPGAKMPGLGLGPQKFHAIVAYLTELE